MRICVAPLCCDCDSPEFIDVGVHAVLDPARGAGRGRVRVAQPAYVVNAEEPNLSFVAPEARAVSVSDDFTQSSGTVRIEYYAPKSTNLILDNLIAAGQARPMIGICSITSARLIRGHQSGASVRR